MGFLSKVKNFTHPATLLSRFEGWGALAPKLKSSLKERWFQTIEEIELNVLRDLHPLPCRKNIPETILKIKDKIKMVETLKGTIYSLWERKKNCTLLCIIENIPAHLFIVNVDCKYKEANLVLYFMGIKKK